jgi:predicted GIY-YIG superfamily endonuclease
MDVGYGQPTLLYRMYDIDGALLYVGITNNWPRRYLAHEQDKWWIGDVALVEFEDYDYRDQAEIAECRVIEDERPIHNDMLAVVSPVGRSDERQSFRVALRSVNSYGQDAAEALRGIVARHPGKTLLECQAGRSIMQMGRVDLTEGFYADLAKFAKRRRATYGVVYGITGSPIRQKHITNFFSTEAQP